MKHWILALAIAMTCRTFQFFPGMPVVQEGWFVACFLLLILVYPFWKAKEYWRFSWFEVYVLALTIVMPLLSAFCAWRISGQSLAYGLVAQRAVGLFGFVLTIMYALRRNVLRVEDIEQSLLLLGWGTLVLYTAMRLFLHPSQFSSYGIGFVTGPGELAQFKLQAFFTVFAFFYYLFRGVRTRSRKDAAIAVLFLASSIGGSGGRALTVSLITAVVFFLWRWGTAAFLVRTLPKMALVLVIVVAAWYALDSETVSGRYQKFAAAFQVAFTGAEVEDASAAARVVEAAVALPHIADHPLLGNGLVSNQWAGKDYVGVGDYFHPSDIGVLGVMYLYGIVGLVLFAWQFRFAVTAAAAIPKARHTPLLDATKGFLLFTALYSITTGANVFSVEVTLLFVTLLRSTATHETALVPQPTLAQS